MYKWKCLTTGICELCYKSYQQRERRQRFCGSLSAKTGCAWQHRLMMKRKYGLSKYYRDKANPVDYERIRATNRRSISKHRDRYLNHCRRYYRAHRESELERKRVYHKANPERVSHWRLNRVHRIRASGGSVTYSQWKAICDVFNNTCVGCNSRDVKLTRDHKIPVIKGGTHTPDNIQPLCQPCNNAKYMRTMFPASRLLDRSFVLVEWREAPVNVAEVFNA